MGSWQICCVCVLDEVCPVSWAITLLLFRTFLDTTTSLLLVRISREWFLRYVSSVVTGLTWFAGTTSEEPKHAFSAYENSFSFHCYEVISYLYTQKIHQTRAEPPPPRAPFSSSSSKTKTPDSTSSTEEGPTLMSSGPRLLFFRRLKDFRDLWTELAGFDRSFPPQQTHYAFPSFSSSQPHTVARKRATLTRLDRISSIQGWSSIRQGLALRLGSFSKLYNHSG